MGTGVNEPRCRLCGATQGLEWCGTCGVLLCPKCRQDLPARIRGFLVKLFGRG